MVCLPALRGHHLLERLFKILQIRRRFYLARHRHETGVALGVGEFRFAVGFARHKSFHSTKNRPRRANGRLRAVPAYLEACDELLRWKALHQTPQDEFGVIVDGAVGQVSDLSLSGNNDAMRLVSVEDALLDEGFNEAG